LHQLLGCKFLNNPLAGKTLTKSQEAPAKIAAQANVAPIGELSRK
jgi:hypothetical protein